MFRKVIKSFKELSVALEKFKSTRTRYKYGEIAADTSVVIDEIGRDWYRIRHRGRPIHLPNWVLDG